MHVQNRNSVAYRLVLVADGSADASVSLTAKRDWDLAAADIILHEAGGRLTRCRRRGPDLQPAGDPAAQPGRAPNPELHARNHLLRCCDNKRA